ncbi:MAG: phosphoglycerate kinase [Lentisphaeria bacterium]|nr:phosphoglycerate kinase [Lentisphaeria bacterium]NQZ71375.1 phosphoglycerate kinase [Lentisphaeria bacterium]
MNKKTVKDIDLAGKKVIMRVDFNVPLDGTTITDDTRIRAAVPTINYILEQGTSLILMSHLGRPKGEKVPELSLKPIADMLSELSGKKVIMAGDCRGAEVKAQADALQAGEILLLENTRFYAAEDAKGDDSDKTEMAKELASLADVFVNDAFGTAHRAHASTAVIADYMDVSVAGLLMEKELEFLIGAIKNAEKPFIAIIGGAKISGKLQVLKSLLDKCDTIIIGGGMAYTFQKKLGYAIGESIHEDELLDTAGEIMEAAKEKGVNLLLPLDNMIADDFSPDANKKVVMCEDGIPDGWEGLDIGPESAILFSDAIAKAKTVVWNGPMGCFEMAPFAAGTNAIVDAVAAADCVSIIGGGDSVSAVNQSGKAGQMSHISTGGGASLELLEGKVLPGVDCLDNK